MQSKKVANQNVGLRDSRLRLGDPSSVTSSDPYVGDDNVVFYEGAACDYDGGCNDCCA